MTYYFKKDRHSNYIILVTYKHNNGKYLKLLQKTNTKRHFVAWGNTKNPDDMGLVELLTEKGNPRRGGGVIKHFHQMIKTLDKIEFEK